MKLFSTLVLIFLSLNVNAQSNFHTLESKDGEIKVYPIYHGSVVLELGGKKIFVDPYGGADRYLEFGKADYILITDIHGDHLNMKTLEKLDLSKAKLFGPQAVIDQLKDFKKDQMIRLNNGSQVSLGKIEIKAIPMYNLPDDSSSRHPKGRGNGYVISFSGKSIYISGDTEDIPEMRSLTEIDLALICMNLPYTMDVYQASDAVLEFEPKQVIPYHYRGKEMSDTSEFKTLVEDKNPSIEVLLFDCYN